MRGLGITGLPDLMAAGPATMLEWRALARQKSSPDPGFGTRVLLSGSARSRGTA